MWIQNASINGTLPLSNLTIRYYFKSALQPLGYNGICDYASVQNVANAGGASIGSDVTFTFGATQSATAGAAYYVQLSFAAATPSMIAAPAGYAQVQVRLVAPSGSFTAASDYSYLAAAAKASAQTGAPANPHITAFQGGQIVWGEEP